MKFSLIRLDFNTPKHSVRYQGGHVKVGFPTTDFKSLLLGEGQIPFCLQAGDKLPGMCTSWECKHGILTAALELIKDKCNVVRALASL